MLRHAALGRCAMPIHHSSAAAGLLILVALMVGHGEGAAAVAPALDPATITAIGEHLDRNWKELEGEPKPTQGVRELFECALEAAGSGWHPERVEHLYSLATRYQDRDPTSKTQGNLHWIFSETAVHDTNAVEFTMQMAALTWAFYRDRLTPAARTLLKELMEHAIVGVRSHQVKEAYTNIYLMKIWNCIALGEALEHPDLADEGYAMLKRWLAFTAANGVSEFLSPTYTGCDLDSLGLIARWAGRDAGRSDARTALAIIWDSLAANWFPPAERISGAHSRDYDYLTGHGRVEAHIQAAGWLARGIEVPNDAMPVAGSVFWNLEQWNPPAEWRTACAPEPPRMVVERVGPEPWERLVNHVGRHFSLASAGFSYGNMDQPVTMCVDGGGKIPMMNLFMDGRGDPYGREKITSGSGPHHKALHLVPFLASVRRDAEVLVALAIDPSGRNLGHSEEEITQLSTELVLPLVDAVHINGRSMPLKDTPIPPGAVVVVVKGDVALGIRVLQARGDGGEAVPVTFLVDGREHGACRLAIQHATGKPTVPASAVLWLRAAEGLDEAGIAHFASTFAAAKATVSGSPALLTLEVAGQSAPMGMELDLVHGTRMRLTGGQADDGAPLQVNGHAIAQPRGQPASR